MGIGLRSLGASVSTVIVGVEVIVVRVTEIVGGAVILVGVGIMLVHVGVGIRLGACLRPLFCLILGCPVAICHPLTGAFKACLNDPCSELDFKRDATCIP